MKIYIWALRAVRNAVTPLICTCIKSSKLQLSYECSITCWLALVTAWHAHKVQVSILLAVDTYKDAVRVLLMRDTQLTVCLKAEMLVQLMSVTDGKCGVSFAHYKWKRSNLRFGLARRLQLVDTAHLHIDRNPLTIAFIWMINRLLNSLSYCVTRT